MGRRAKRIGEVQGPSNEEENERQVHRITADPVKAVRNEAVGVFRFHRIDRRLCAQEGKPCNDPNGETDAAKDPDEYGADRENQRRDPASTAPAPT